MREIYFIFLLKGFTVFAQVGGESVFNFLNVPTSAHQTALGGKTLTLMGDISQPIWNPAVINEEMKGQINLNYLNFIGDINYYSTSYAHYVDRRIGTFHSNLTYVDYGKFIEADEEGVETGTFKAYDMSLSVGYAYNFPKTNIYVGSNIKIIQSKIEKYSSLAAAVDIGLIYYKDDNPLSLALSVRNIGHQFIAFDEKIEKLPFEILMGASYKLENVPLKWHITIDNLQQWQIANSNPSNTITNINGKETLEKISFIDNAFRHFILGVELFPDKNFNLRMGYNFKKSKEFSLLNTRSFAGLTAGFGLKMNKIKLNYAFSKYHPVSNTHTFSLNLYLNNN
ncbi:MAG: type IX secretion system protein PorQ [Flavobacteriaceae bacterium]|nr:type IX secretion system protein PorQ [Flavobacteriaceae bacterium]